MYLDSSKRLREHYRLIVIEARKIAMEEWIASGYTHVRLADIGPLALAETEAWLDRKVSWQWPQLYKKWSRRPMNFGLAMWVDPKLCGLGLGKVTDGRAYARMDRLERAPTATDKEVGSVAELAILFLEAVGKIAGCKEVVLWQPAKELVEYYKAFGFTTEIIKHGKIVGLKRMLS